MTFLELLQSFIEPLVAVAIMMLIYMCTFFVYSIIRKRNDIVDVAWGLAFMAIVTLLYALFGNAAIREYVLLALVYVWGIRLATHIFLRNKGKKEDYRYEEFREKWGGHPYLGAFLQVYMLQGFLAILVMFPVIVTFKHVTGADELFWLNYVGIAVWVLGFYFETVGDYQLSQFLKDSSNKGKIMTSGLWKYTRHPNYFGEVTQWWGVFLVCFGALPAFNAVLLLGPLSITFLILKVSGIPMLERKYDDNLEFQAYKKRTNAFFPGPQKNV